MAKTDNEKSLSNMLCMLFTSQACAVVMALSSVCITHLKKFDLNLPFSINIVPYIFIGIMTTPYAIYMIFNERTPREAWQHFKEYGYVYLLIALCEIGNYWALTTSYFLTNLVSVQTLSSFAIFSGMFLSYFLFKLKYIYTHYFGLLLCLMGYSMMITADYMSGIRTDYLTSSHNRTYVFDSRKDIIFGDILAIVGSICFGFSLTLQEFIIRRDGNLVNMGTYSFVACVTLVPFILGTEKTKIEEILVKVSEDFYPASVGWAFFSYAGTIVILVLLINYFLYNWSSVFLTMSLLSTNFYALLFATLIFQENFSSLFFFAFCIIAFGCVMFGLIPPEKMKKTS